MLSSAFYYHFKNISFYESQIKSFLGVNYLFWFAKRNYLVQLY